MTNRRYHNGRPLQSNDRTLQGTYNALSTLAYQLRGTCDLARHYIRNPTVSGTSTHTDAANAQVSAAPAASAAPTAKAAISPFRIPDHRPTTNWSTNNAAPSSAATPLLPPLAPANLTVAAEASLASTRPFFDPQEGPSTQRRPQTPLTPPTQPQAGRPGPHARTAPPSPSSTRSSNAPSGTRHSWTRRGANPSASPRRRRAGRLGTGAARWATACRILRS